MKKNIKPGWRAIIKRFGTWNVTGYGIEHAGPGPYAIPIKRLWEPRLVEHMNEKNWVNILDFRMALKFAQEYFERKEAIAPLVFPTQGIDGQVKVAGMTEKEFANLKTGDIVRGLGSGQTFIVSANYGNRVTGVQTVDLTNPREWALIFTANHERKSE